MARRMENCGFGLPFLAAQLTSRVEPAALSNVAMLASCRQGFGKVAQDFNSTQHKVAHTFLGLQDNIRLGSRIDAFADSWLLTRTGTQVAVKIAMAWAWILLLPDYHPAQVAVKGAGKMSGITI